MIYGTPPLFHLIKHVRTCTHVHVNKCTYIKRSCFTERVDRDGRGGTKKQSLPCRDSWRLEGKFLDEQVDIGVNLEVMEVISISLETHQEPSIGDVS